MKRSIMVIMALLLAAVIPAGAQGRFLKNVAKDIKSEVLGSSGGKTTTNTQPEPKCACNPAEEVLGLNSMNVLYSEISIDMMDDGSFLVREKISGNNYIVKDGVKKGPYNDDSPQLAAFKSREDEDANAELMRKYKDYISKSGDKYIIKFGGKTYGPYAVINQFAVPKSRDKFAALVTENVMNTENDGERMEAAIKNAKTDQEKMELAMKFSQEMQQKMMAAGGTSGIMPKFITSMPDAKFQPISDGNGLYDRMKYDDILSVKYDQLVDLKGNKIMAIKPQDAAAKEVFVNTSNTKYAWYEYGSLNFSDGTTLSELFNPHLLKVDGKVYLAYLYYSPAKNAIMRCKILF